jgi:hypothetical protein
MQTFCCKRSPLNRDLQLRTLVCNLNTDARWWIVVRQQRVVYGIEGKILSHISNVRCDIEHLPDIVA